MEQKQGTISENELMMKLAGARKIMSEVDSGKYRGKATMPEMPMNVNIPEEFNQTSQLDPRMQQPKINNSTRPVGGYPMNEEKIRNSKLPEAIKEAMINNPIEQPSINNIDSLDMKIFEGAKRLMNEQSIQSKHTNKPTQPNIPSQNYSSNKSFNAEELTPIIENVIRKVLDEKLTQILTAYSTGTINENLAIKVGDSIFHGKITKVKNTK